MSALAIGFAESISRLRRGGHPGLQLELHARHLRALRGDRQLPAVVPARGRHVLAAGRGRRRPLFLQARALRGRSYAILSGRTRQAVRRRLSRWEAVAAGSGLALFFLVILGIPAFGAVSASLLADYGASFSLSWANYPALFQQPGLIGPLERSLIYGVITAIVTVLLGFIVARMLSAAADRGHRGDGLPAARLGGAARRGVRRGLHLRLQPADHVHAAHQPVPDRAAAGHRLHRLLAADQRPGARRFGLADPGVAARRRPGARRRAPSGRGRAACCRCCPGRS